MNSLRKRKTNTFIKATHLAAVALLLLVSTQQTLAATSAYADGATFPAPFIVSSMNQFDTLNPGYLLSYGGGGSGQGQSHLFSSITQFGASDAPLNDAQIALHPGILHIPETIGSVTLSYTIPNATVTGNTCPTGPSSTARCLPKDLNLTATIIAEIYMGNITMWNDAQIKAINPAWTSYLPAHSITTVHRCDSSGTTFVFTNFLALASPNNWQKNIGNGTSVNWGTKGTPAGICGNGNGGVASQVQANPYYIGYVELNYALGQSLSFAQVNEAIDGRFVEPSLISTQNAVVAGASTLPTGAQSWAHVSLLNESAPYPTYPIASFTYFLVRQEMNTTSSSLAQANLVSSYLWWHIQAMGGQSLATGLYYVPLPTNVINIDEATINLLTYNGKTVSHILPTGTPPNNSNNLILYVGIAIILIVIFAGGFFYLRRSRTESIMTTAATPETRVKYTPPLLLSSRRLQTR